MELINEKEGRVLESLYKLGQSAVQAISKDTLVNRTALYHTLDSLMKKGLITRLVKDKVSYYEAIPLDQYELWVQAKLDNIKEESSNNLKRFSEVKSDKKMSLYADVKYFEGKEGIKSLYNDSIYNNKEKVLFSITDYDKGYETLDPAWLEHEYLPTRVKKGIRVKNIVPDTKYSRKYTTTAKELLRDMSFVNFFNDLGVEISLYDNKMSIVAFDKVHPLGVIIQNEIISKAFKAILEYIWKTGEIVGENTNTKVAKARRTPKK